MLLLSVRLPHWLLAQVLARRELLAGEKEKSEWTFMGR
jgi:hypothetical protein